MTPASNVVELLQTLVQIPSVNPHGNPGVEFPGEEACARSVAAFLHRCGARTELREVHPGRPNVVGIFPSEGAGKKRVVFAPHLDTVSVVGMSIDPFAAELRNGRVYGRGACDTKGPMAAMLWALWEMRDRIPTLGHEIWFAGLMGEEAGQDGAKAFVKEVLADFAVIGEPTGLDIVHAHKGSAWLQVTTRGKAAHASAPDRGENAIYKMADVIRCVRDEIAPALRELKDSVLGAPTISVGICSGGTKTNIVPDHCIAEIDMRTLPNQDIAPVIERLRAVAPGIEISVRRSQPLYTDPTHPMVGRLKAAGGKCVGAPWFCDAAVFAAAGIPAVAVGPGSIEQAHTEDEWISVEDLEAGVAFYKRFLASLSS